MYLRIQPQFNYLTKSFCSPTLPIQHSNIISTDLPDSGNSWFVYYFVTAMAIGIQGWKMRIAKMKRTALAEDDYDGHRCCWRRWCFDQHGCQCCCRCSAGCAGDESVALRMLLGPNPLLACIQNPQNEEDRSQPSLHAPSRTRLRRFVGMETRQTMPIPERPEVPEESWILWMQTVHPSLEI